jgi:hypothetical protein
VDTPLWAAIDAVKRGLSANAGLQEARSLGLGVRRDTWLKMYAQVRSDLSAQGQEVTARLDARPTSAEVSTMFTRQASGFMHHVTVYLRDKETGELILRPYSVPSDTLLTRADAIATAIDRFQTSASARSDLYPEVVLGATYTSTYIMVPQGS